MRILDARTVRRVQRLALANGGSVRSFADGSRSRTVEWDVSGNCLSPVRVELHGRAAAETGVKQVYVCSDANAPNFVEMTVPCRKCSNCLRRRATMWRLRAVHEYRMSLRTWFATLTLNPESVITLLSRARVRLRKQGIDYDGLPGEEQFLLLEREGFAELQKWMKRVRKSSSSPIRYLAITEAHKSGVPHWHVLIHETGKPLSYDRCLKGSWHLGFDSYKLVRNTKAAGYVCKYLSKAVAARVRASSRYGGTVVPTLPPKAEVS